MRRRRVARKPVGLPRSPRAIPLSALLDSWVSEGVITAAQAAVIIARGDVAVTPGPAARPRASRTLAAEALGYLGGVVTVVSTLLIAQMYWADVSLGGRLAVVAAAAGALFVGGLSVPGRLGEVGDRLRSVLWLASTVSVAGLLDILGADALDLPGAHTAVLVSLGTAVTAAGLWSAHHHFLQHTAMMVALMAAAAAVTADFVGTEQLPGLGAWLVAVTWLALGVRGMLSPPRPVIALSCAAAIVSGLTTFPADWGILLALVTVAGVVMLAIRRADLLLLGVGAVGTFAVVPSAVGQWFPDSAAVPFVLLAVGLLLVVVALWTARRHREQPTAAEERTV